MFQDSEKQKSFARLWELRDFIERERVSWIHYFDWRKDKLRETGSSPTTPTYPDRQPGRSRANIPVKLFPRMGKPGRWSQAGGRGAPGKVVRVTNRNIAGVGLWFCRLPKPITYLSTSQGHWLPLALRSLTQLAVALVSTIRAVAPFWTDGGMVKTRQHKRPGPGCKSWPLFTCGTHPIDDKKL